MLFLPCCRRRPERPVPAAEGQRLRMRHRRPSPGAGPGPAAAVAAASAAAALPAPPRPRAPLAGGRLGGPAVPGGEAEPPPDPGRARAFQNVLEAPGPATCTRRAGRAARMRGAPRGP